jgi:hypothetical protein
MRMLQQSPQQDHGFASEQNPLNEIGSLFDKQTRENPNMRTLVISTFAALLFSTGLALAQGSGAAGDIGSGTPRAQSAPAVGTTTGQSATEPSAPAPKAKKSAAKKKKGSE